MYGSRIWENIRLLYTGDTKPLYYLIEYNRLDLLIAVKNKNIDDDLMWEKTFLFYWGFSLDVLYSEMSSISINELCFEPAKNLNSGFWRLLKYAKTYAKAQL